MEKKYIKKIGVTLILLVLFLQIIISIPIFSVKALSDESTGLYYVGQHRNQGKHCYVGEYDIFATDRKLLFYDATGELIKTLDLGQSPYFGSGYANAFDTVIFKVNETHIIYATEYCASGTYLPTGIAVYVDINTLTTTTIFSAITQASGISTSCGLVTLGNGYTYFVTAHTYPSQVRNLYVRAVYPTLGSAIDITGIMNEGFFTGSLFIPSTTSDTEFYVICATSWGGNRYAVYTVDVNTPTFTKIGISGTDNTYGGYVYYFGSTYSTTDTNNTYVDVGIIYNNPSVNKDIYPQIIRFNSSTVDYYRSVLSVDSSVNTLRCLDVSYDGVWNKEDLIEGQYEYYYIGADYGAMYCPFTVFDLDTDTPTCYINDLPDIFGDNGVQFSHYYTSSASIGGYLVSTGVIIEYDFINSKCIADLWLSLNPVYSYIFSVTPTAISIISSGTTLRAVCWQGTNYMYNGELFMNQIRSGNGTYTVSSTGLSLAYNIDSGTYGSTSTSGYVTNGILNFTITQRTSAYATIYEGIKVTIEIGGYETSFTHLFVWTINADEDGLPHTSATPTPTPDTTGGLGFGGGAFSVSTMVGIMVIIIFAVFFGVIAGRDGLLAGLMISIFVCSIAGLFPIWGIIFAIILGALLILSHTSFNLNNGGN